MNSEKIGFIEAIALVSIVITNKIILNTPKDIISSTRFFCMAKLFIRICCGCFSYLVYSLFI